jgi:hypothetical protein
MLGAAYGTLAAGDGAGEATGGTGFVAAGAAGAAKGEVRISPGVLGSVGRFARTDPLPFAGLGGAAALGGVIAVLASAGAFRRPAGFAAAAAGFAEVALSGTRDSSTSGRDLARLAAELPAGASVGLDLPRALGLLGVLAMISVSCRFRA